MRIWNGSEKNLKNSNTWLFCCWNSRNYLNSIFLKDDLELFRVFPEDHNDHPPITVHKKLNLLNTPDPLSLAIQIFRFYLFFFDTPI